MSTRAATWLDGTLTTSRLIGLKEANPQQLGV
jgi:hypothetical protein